MQSVLPNVPHTAARGSFILSTTRFVYATDCICMEGMLCRVHKLAWFSFIRVAPRHPPVWVVSSRASSVILSVVASHQLIEIARVCQIVSRLQREKGGNTWECVPVAAGSMVSAAGARRR